MNAKSTIHPMAHRWHVEIRLEAPSDIDSEIRDLLKAAYEIS